MTIIIINCCALTRNKNIWVVSILLGIESRGKFLTYGPITTELLYNMKESNVRDLVGRSDRDKCEDSITGFVPILCTRIRIYFTARGTSQLSSWLMVVSGYNIGILSCVFGNRYTCMPSRSPIHILAHINKLYTFSLLPTCRMYQHLWRYVYNRVPTHCRSPGVFAYTRAIDKPFTSRMLVYPIAFPRRGW